MLLFRSEQGFCYVYAIGVRKNCQLVLLRCPEKMAHLHLHK